MKFASTLAMTWLLKTLLVSKTSQLLQFNELYEGLHFITDTTSEKIVFDNPSKFSLRRIELEEDKHEFVIEYQLNREGVVSIIHPNEGETQDYTIYVDYLLKGMPFILGSMTLDLSDPKQSEIFKAFPNFAFTDDVVSEKRQILRRMNRLAWSPEELELLRSILKTHRFVKFTADHDKLASSNFSIRLDNDIVKQDFMQQLNAIIFLTISAEKFNSIVPVLIDKVIEFGYNPVYNQIDGDYNLNQKTRLSKKEELNKNREEVLAEVQPVIEEYQELVTSEGAVVFDIEGLEKKVKDLNRMFNTIKNGNIVLPGALFYQAKYAFESGRSETDPVDLVNRLGKDVESPDDLRDNFVEVLRSLCQVHFSFLEEAFEHDGFNTKSSQIIGKINENLEGYYEKMGLDVKEHEDMVEDAKAQLRRIFVDGHVDQMLFFKKLNPVFDHLRDYIQNSNSEVFEKKEVETLKNSYFEIGSLDIMTNEDLEYARLDGDLFEFYGLLIL